MKKSTYIFICFLLSVNFWNLSFITHAISNNILLALTWFWSASGFLLFKRKQPIINQTDRLPYNLYKLRYIQYMYWIFLGVFISIISAYYFWKQDFIISLFAQRGIYSFIVLLALLYVQPSERDILKGLKWISIGTMIAWVLVAFNPALISIDVNDVSRSDSDFGYYVTGIQFVVLYLYFKAQQLIYKFNRKDFLELSLLLIFVFLYQNRSMLFGVGLVLIYTLFKIKSRYKFWLLSLLGVLLIVAIVATWNIWMNLYTETQGQLIDPDYNRNKALNYYIFDYSPNWFCYIFGNGFPSGGNSPLGNLMWDNFKIGIFASDLGMIGMWSDFGIIPLVTIYSVLFTLFFKKYYPLYLKFISFHILFVPTIFHFWKDPGVFLFVLIFYLFSYNTERNKYLKKNAIRNNCQLQKPTENHRVYTNRAL